MKKLNNKVKKFFGGIVRWYLGKEYTPKDIVELILTIVAIVLIILGFLKNKVYYEDVSLEFYSVTTQETAYPKNVADEIELDNHPNKVVLVSPANVPMKVDIVVYKSGIDNYQYNGISKSIAPGDALKIFYTESETIPIYRLHISTEYGDSTIPLTYNGRFGNVNKTKIKATRKVIPYFLDKIFN